MFGLISTKDLYLLKLQLIKQYIFENNRLIAYELSTNPRYVLAKRTSIIDYKDIFNHTTYNSFECMIGQEMITGTLHFVTDKKYITSNEAKKLIKKYNK